MFIDETGFLMLPTVRRTWAPRGQTPRLHHRTRSHQKVSTIGALTISPRRQRCGLYLHWHPDQNISAEHIVAFLQDLLRHLRGHVIVLWDRLSAHRSRRVQSWREVYDRLTLEWFPPYAPELNPVEYVWSHLKYHRTANHGLFELDAIHKQVRHEADDTAANQPLLRGFVHASRLPIRFK